jgi:hypothetical protein
VFVVVIEQETVRWTPTQVIAGFLATTLQGIVVLGLISATRFRFSDTIVTKPASSPMYFIVWPISPSDIRGKRYLPLPPTVTPPRVQHVFDDLPEPNPVIPDTGVPQISWVAAARRATDAEAMRERFSARLFTAPAGSGNADGTHESTSSGRESWDAAKRKGLELDDYESRLWVNEHCYLYAGQPAPLQYLGAKCRVGTRSSQGDLFDDLHAKAPAK